MGQRTVNERQLRVLEWIVDGCPDGVMSGPSHKTTAVALQNRRLVTISKRRGVWSAVATDAGRYFAQHRSYPNNHWTSGSTTHPQPSTTRATSTPRTAKSVTGLRPVDQMLAEIAEAGGTLDVNDPEGYYQRLVSSATRSGKVPDGKVLQILARRGWGKKTLRLVDQPSWMTAELAPIVISERLHKPHGAVAALRADREHRLRFKRDVRQRALLMLDAVAKEASRRGHAVTCPLREHHQRTPPADLLIEIHGHPHALHVSEDTDKVQHEPTAKELRDHERWHYRIPKYDKVPSGRLQIAISGGIPVRQSTFADTKTINLAARLPVLLQELELRAANSEERRLQAERERAERHRQWEQVRDQAITDLREENRSQVLAAQAKQWHHTRQVSDYLDAMETHIADLDSGHQRAAIEWLNWAREHLATRNPLNQPLAMPPDPEVTAETLKPFMKGHSPYGPDRMYGW